MHGIAETVRRLRARPGAVGFVGANGGFLSQYSVGIYPRPNASFSRSIRSLCRRRWTPGPALDQGFEGYAAVETYTIDYAQASPRGVVVARSPAGARVVAMTDDPAVTAQMIETDPLGRQLRSRPATKAGGG